MAIIDFGSSFVTFFTTAAQDHSIARIQIDATCTVTDERSGTTETYVLSAPCRAEHMYRDESLFIMPSYEFRGIFSQDRCLLLRTHWTSDRDWHEPGSNTERFSRVTLDLRHDAEARVLNDPAAIVAATLANQPLVVTTELRDEARGVHALLTYPIKTQNVIEHPPRFQVDTGPVLLPDFTAAARNPIERFHIAHVVYHRLDRAEFVIRQPVPVGDRDGIPVAVTDYSVIQVHPAQHQLWSRARQ